jgi:hypothetical protein
MPAVAKGQVNVYVRTFENRPVLLEEPTQHPMEVGRRGRKGGPQEVLDARLELGGKNGGKHVI